MSQRIFTVNWVNKLLFCITFILKYFTDVFFVAQGKGGFVVSSKYIPLIFGIACSYAIIYKRKEVGIKIIFTKELKQILLVIAVFALLSFLQIIITGMMTIQTATDLLYMFLAVVYAYGILNSFSFVDMLTCMKILLIAAIVAYVLEIGTGNFTLSNLLISSFINSTSVFESNYSASASMIMCTFFCYYRKEWKWTLIAFVFCILTFKRMNIIFAFFFLVYPMVFNPNKKVSKKLVVALTVIFAISTLAFYQLYQVENAGVFEKIFHMSATKFSTGRNLYLQRILDNGYKSYGYGSTTAFLGQSIEMEFIKIYMELGIIALVLFIWKYYKISINNAYCFWIMTENMLNFLTSHSLSSVFNWGMRFILIGLILYRVRAEYEGITFFKSVTYEAVDRYKVEKR